MSAATVELTHLDTVWFQVAGTLCNLACTHCFNHSGPGVRTFGMLGEETFRRELACAEQAGVREIFFTGGEPLLHPRLLDFAEQALRVAPATILTNATRLSDACADRLAAVERATRYSLEIRVSLDGYSEEMNDVIRGRGVFRRVLEAIARLSQRGLLPLVTIVRTWPEERELETVGRFVEVLKAAGCHRPRLKILPALPLGRELDRIPHEVTADHVSEEMLNGFDRDLLMCSNSRVVTDRGICVCPLLVESAAARVGSDLANSTRRYRLRHTTCVECWRYGTICANLRPDIEAPPAAAP